MSTICQNLPSALLMSNADAVSLLNKSFIDKKIKGAIFSKITISA